MFLRRIAMLVLACAVAVFPLSGVMAHADRTAKEAATPHDVAGHMHQAAHARHHGQSKMPARGVAENHGHKDHAQHARMATRASGAGSASAIINGINGVLAPAMADDDSGGPLSHVHSCCDGAPCLSLILCLPENGTGLRLSILVVSPRYEQPLRHVAPGVPERPPRPVH